jgi:hypothetical protein
MSNVFIVAIKGWGDDVNDWEEVETFNTLLEADAQLTEWLASSTSILDSKIIVRDVEYDTAIKNLREADRAIE